MLRFGRNMKILAKRVHRRIMNMQSPTFNWPEGRRAALSLTFDDARPSQLDVGLPLMDSYGVKGTFYISYSHFNKRVAEWQDVVKNGHEIGNHTFHHPCSANFVWAREHALEDYTLEQMEQDILAANTHIETSLGVKPVTFAYPCGQRYVGRGEQVRSYVPLIARYFLAGRTFRDESPIDPAYCDLAQIGAGTMDDIPFDTLKAYIDQAIANGHWLVFAGHEVGESGRQTVRTEVLKAICEYARQQDQTLWLDTVAVIASYVQAARASR